jgi:ribonuclease HI
MRTTAGDVLSVHAHLPFPHLLFLKSLIRVATRLVTLPVCHPLHKPVQRAVKRSPKRHRSPLHLLFLTTAVKPQNYETILTTRRRRNYSLLANIVIEEDRQKAIAAAHDIGGTAIYTDGSGFENKIGAAAVLIINGTNIKTLKYHLGTHEEHTVYEAEAVAVTLALHMLAERKQRINKVTIGMDNQAVLLGLQNQKSRPGHHIMDRIHDAVQDFQAIQARRRGITLKGYRKGKGRTKLADGSKGWEEWKLKRWCYIEFVWTPGHEDIEGNELADELAKLAAQGESSNAQDLPTYLRKKPLPISISATRQQLKKDLKARWLREWADSPRHDRTATIDKSLPSDDFLHIIDQLQRNQASLLTQLRTGHIPLNHILFRIKRAETTHCPHCGQGSNETITHFLFFCPHYARARGRLMASVGRNEFTSTHLMSSRKGIPLLLHYVSDTGRLRATFGEVRPKDNLVIKEKPVKEKTRTRIEPEMI